MRSIFISLLPLLVAGLLLSVSVTAGTDKTPRISVTESRWDFGSVPIDYKLIHYFVIENTGTADLIINRAISNCDCTTIHLADTLVPPDSAVNLKIIFDTKEYYGQTSREVIIDSNDPLDSTIELSYASVIGFFPKELLVEPKSLFFLKGQAAREIKLMNKSAENIEYSIEMEPDSSFTLDRTAGEIEPGKEAILMVTPVQKARGTHYSNFTVTYESNGKRRLTVPIKIVNF